MNNSIKAQKQICIIGLGSVGLPLACVLATSGYAVLGVDTDKERLDRIASAKLFSSEPKLKALLTKAIQNSNFKVSAKVSLADIYIITVPTPLGFANQPDLTCVNSAIQFIKPQLREQDLVLIESTCPVGTTEKIAQELRVCCPKVSVAYCPERIFPGNILYELIHNNRIVGGVDHVSTKRAVDFYKSFTCGKILDTEVRMAEAVKLAENVYRDVNIAYANELSMIASHLDLDANKLIHLANEHPRVNILNPGVGVGGDCIAVDPWFLIASKPELALLSSKAREVNLNKTDWVIQKIRSVINGSKISVVAFFGLTYKPNVSDTRNSPALTIIKAFEEEIEVLKVDPYVSNTESINSAINRAHIVVGLVAHKEFLNIPPEQFIGKEVLDFSGVFR